MSMYENKRSPEENTREGGATAITDGQLSEEQSPCLNSNDFSKVKVVNKTVTFEEVLVTTGEVGKFQIIQGALCLTCLQLLSFMSLGFVFIGYTPPHQCKTVNETKLLGTYGLLNDSNAQVSYGQCDVTVFTNQSGQHRDIAKVKCPQGRYFPRGKYMTLVSEWDMVCEMTGQPEFAQMLFTLGTVAGGLFVPTLADKFGRKPVACVTVIFCMICELSITFAPNFIFVCSILFFDGLSSAGISAVYLVLGMEMLMPRHRRIFGAIACYLWICNILFIGFTGYIMENVGWRYFQLTGALTGILSLSLPFFLYESPRWLAINGRSREALTILEKACKLNGRDNEKMKKVFESYMSCLFKQQEQEKYIHGNDESPKDLALVNRASVPNLTVKEKVLKKYTLLSMFTKKETLILLLVMWYIWTACYLTYYGIYMSSSDLVGNRFLNFVLLALVEFPATVFVQFMMKRMGRLTVLRIFLIMAITCLLSSMLLAQFNDDSNSSKIAVILLFVLGKFAISCTFNAIFIFTPEVFPTVLRSAGNGSCKSIPRIGSMLAPYSRPLYAVAKWAPGLIFTSACFLAFFLTFFLPETKDKILPTQLNDIINRKQQALKEQEDIEDEC